MPCRGVRGATTADANTPDDILRATRELLALMIRQNGIRAEDVASVIFSTTPDLNAEFPALVARQLGWLDVEHAVQPPSCMCRARCSSASACWCIGIRTYPSKPEIVHVYIKEAANVRPDRTQLPPVTGTNWKPGSSQRLADAGVNSGRVALVTGRGRKLPRIDVQVDLIAGPGHAAAIHHVVADGRPKLRREVVTQGEAEFRHSRELTAIMYAHVAR